MAYETKTKKNISFYENNHEVLGYSDYSLWQHFSYKYHTLILNKGFTE